MKSGIYCSLAAKAAVSPRCSHVSGDRQVAPRQRALNASLNRLIQTLTQPGLFQETLATVRYLFQFSPVDLLGICQIKRQFIMWPEVMRNASSAFCQDLCTRVRPLAGPPS